MNYYAARQRDGDSCWDWTVMNGNQVWRCGACAGGIRCQHKTKEEAMEHESSRVRELFKSAKIYEIDTKLGHACNANVKEGCTAKAFQEIHADNTHYELCEQHMSDFSWYSVGERVSSY